MDVKIAPFPPTLSHLPVAMTSFHFICTFDDYSLPIPTMSNYHLHIQLLLRLMRQADRIQISSVVDCMFCKLLFNVDHARTPTMRSYSSHILLFTFYSKLIPYWLGLHVFHKAINQNENIILYKAYNLDYFSNITNNSLWNQQQQIIPHMINESRRITCRAYNYWLFGLPAVKGHFVLSFRTRLTVRGHTMVASICILNNRTFGEF